MLVMWHRKERSLGGLEQSRGRRSFRRSPGFSLIEVLIVVALMGLLAGVVIAGTGFLGGSRLRAGASMVMGAVRLGVSHANASGQPARLVFDFEARRIVLEEARGRFVRSSPHDQEAQKAEAASAQDFEKQANEYARSLLAGPKAPVPRFSPVAALAGDDGKPGRELDAGVRLLQVQTEHDLEPRTEGRSYLYFWPGGGTEQAAIQLGRGEELDAVTVLVSALTGRAKLQRGRVELEDGRADPELGEREEP
jgi:general secretion pathway protein H